MTTGRLALAAVNLGLAVLAVVLGIRLYSTGTARRPVLPAPPATATPPAAPAAPTVPARTRPPLSQFVAVAERNPFSPSRTETPPEPPRPSPASAGPPVPPPPRPRLHGVVILPSGQGRAWLEDVARQRTHAYSVGDSVADSRVEEIKPDRVVMRRGAEKYEVLLNDPTKPRAPAPAAPGAARPDVQSSQPGIRPGPGARVPPGLPGTARRLGQMGVGPGIQPRAPGIPDARPVREPVSTEQDEEE